MTENEKHYLTTVHIYRKCGQTTFRYIINMDLNSELENANKDTFNVAFELVLIR